MAREQPVLPKASDLLELASRPAQVIEHPSWTTARETALAQVAAVPCLVVMLGPPGSGKSTLLRNLAMTIRERGRAACLLEFDDSRFDPGRADVVLVDEADRIGVARLNELSGRGKRPLVLAALPASAECFRHHAGVTVVRLAPLSADQACAFLAERLAQLGLPMACLTEAAWAGLVAHARGVPRLLIALLSLSLLVAGEGGASQVTGSHVEQAVAVRGGGAASDKIEPPRANGDLAGRDVPVFLGDAPAADSTADLESERRRRRRTQAVATLVAICLFAAAGVVLSGGRLPAVDQTASSGSKGPSSVGMEKAVSVTAVNRRTAPSPPKEVALAPTVPAGPVIRPAPVPPPAAPASAPNGATAPPTQAVSAVAQELPSGAVVHVVMIYPRGDQAAAQRGLELARVLRSDGFAVGDPFPVPPREWKRGISYYFAQDEGAATEIGRRIGGQYGDGRLVRPSLGAGLPRPGTIEVALGD